PHDGLTKAGVLVFTSLGILGSAERAKLVLSPLLDLRNPTADGGSGHLLAVAVRAPSAVTGLVHNGLLGLRVNLELAVLALHEVVRVPELKQVVNHVLTLDATTLGDRGTDLIPELAGGFETEHPGKLSRRNTRGLNKLVDVTSRGLVHVPDAVTRGHGPLEHLRVKVSGPSHRVTHGPDNVRGLRRCPVGGLCLRLGLVPFTVVTGDRPDQLHLVLMHRFDAEGGVNGVLLNASHFLGRRLLGDAGSRQTHLSEDSHIRGLDTNGRQHCRNGPQRGEESSGDQSTGLGNVRAQALNLFALATPPGLEAGEASANRSSVILHLTPVAGELGPAGSKLIPVSVHLGPEVSHTGSPSLSESASDVLAHLKVCPAMSRSLLPCSLLCITLTLTKELLVGPESYFFPACLFTLGDPVGTLPRLEVAHVLTLSRLPAPSLVPPGPLLSLSRLPECAPGGRGSLLSELLLVPLQLGRLTEPLTGLLAVGLRDLLFDPLQDLLGVQGALLNRLLCLVGSSLRLLRDLGYLGSDPIGERLTGLLPRKAHLLLKLSPGLPELLLIDLRENIDVTRANLDRPTATSH